MPGDPNLQPVERYDWERTVRRVRMNPSTKLVALALASYANRDGTSAYPGAAKLAAVTGLTERTVRTALASLRDLGLLHRVREGRRAGRAALADEHDLTRPVDLIDRVHMLDVAESPETISCDRGCQHKGSPVLSSGDLPVDNPAQGRSTGQEHRKLTTGTPELSDRTPEMRDRNTGTQFPPPTPHRSPYQLQDQRDDHVLDVTTRGARVNGHAHPDDPCLDHPGQLRRTCRGCAADRKAAYR